MKIKGKKISGSNFEYVIIPRPDENVVFKCAAIVDETEFERLCKQPEPPTITKPGGQRFPDFDDEDYKKAVQTFIDQRYAWLVITSLAATEALEWETVKPLDPTTWINYEGELKASGFTQGEIGRIVRGCMIANSLDEKKLEEARASFLRSLPEGSAR